MVNLSSTLVYAENEIKPPDTKPEIKPPDWVIMAAPQAGWIENKTRFSFDAGGSTQRITMTDDGWGSGFAAIGLYKWLVWTNVFYYFNDVNDSNFLGGVTHLTAAIPTDTFVSPYFALGLFFMNIETRIRDYEGSQDGQMSNGTLTTGYASIDNISADNRILTPLPEIGLKFKIPIQDWWITPYYSYWYEDVKTKIRIPRGQVDLYERGTRNFIQTLDIELDKEIKKNHQSHMLGFWFSLDLYHFLQLQGNVYYNLSEDLISARFVGTFIFSEYVGITAYFEYQELIPVDNIYFFVGPCFVFMPPGFFDSLMSLRYR